MTTGSIPDRDGDHERMTMADINLVGATFAGYAATFGTAIQTDGSVIHHGEFAQTLKEWRAKGRWPPMLLHHGRKFELPVGHWTLMEEDSHGLLVTGRL